MTEGSDARLLTGRARLDPPPLELHAGPVVALLDGVDLRHVRLGGVELVQRVYVAVRDAPWNTIPATITDRIVDAGGEAFHVRFRASHRHEAIAFDWDGTIEGTPDGVIRYTMDGVCRGSFQYSKIGFNVHHALAGSVGRPYRAQTPTGELRGTLPHAIDPQRIVNGTLSGMFDPYEALAIEVVDGIEAVVQLDGDLLELQDHRNWTDANFKSYGTPLSLGFPFDSLDGQRIRQVLTILARGEAPTASTGQGLQVEVGESPGQRLPAVGLGQPSHKQGLSEREAGLIAALHPAHLRVDVQLADPSFVDDLARAAGDARAVGADLELAVFANDGSAVPLAELAARLATLDGRVARVLVYLAAEGFSALSAFTPAAVVRLVRIALQPVVGDVVFAGGTNQNFADINRDRPTDPVMTGICFSTSPTVHAADDMSVMENISGQGQVVRMARSFSGDRAICVSPVTLATRFGPYPAGPAAPGDLPPSVDVRQASLFGAAWITGALKYLSESGTASVTLFETTGWQGIVETDAGNPMPELFPSRAKDVFPMYHVLSDLGEWRGGSVLGAASSDPIRVEALAVETPDGARHLLVACLVPDSVDVKLTGLPDGMARIRALDLRSGLTAMRDPAGFRASGDPVEIERGQLAVTLGPYSVVRVDIV
jgi:D-apionolactonase